MPYVICAACRLRTYSAALWASTEECPRCGAHLPSARRTELFVAAARDELLAAAWRAEPAPQGRPERADA